MKPARCPVCNGSGVVRVEVSDEIASVEQVTVTCHGCGGKGWVEVSEVDECVIVPRQEEPKTNESRQTAEEETEQEEEKENE